MRDTHMNISAVPTLSLIQLHVSLLSLLPLSITQLLSATQLLSLLHNCSLLSLLPNSISVYSPYHPTTLSHTTASTLSIAHQSTLSATQLLSLLHTTSLLSLLHISLRLQSTRSTTQLHLRSFLHNSMSVYFSLHHTTAVTRSTTQRSTLSLTQLCPRSLLPNCPLLHHSIYSLSYPTACQSTSLLITQLHSTITTTQQSTLSLIQLHVSLLSLVSLYYLSKGWLRLVGSLKL